MCVYLIVYNGSPNQFYGRKEYHGQLRDGFLLSRHNIE